MAKANYTLQSPAAAGELARIKASMITQPLAAGLQAIPEAMDLHDIGLAQKVDGERRKYESDLRLRMESDPYLLIDEAGNPREDVIEQEQAAFDEMMDGAKAGGFWSPERQMQVNGRMKEYRDSFGSTLRTAQVRQVKQWGVGNYQANLAMALDRGDFYGARDAVSGAAEAGLLMPHEAKMAFYELDEKKLTTDAMMAWKESPEALATLWDEGYFDGASLGTQQSVESMLARVSGVPDSAPARLRTSADGKTQKLPPSPPRGLPDYLVGSWYSHGGNYTLVETQREMMPLLTTWTQSQIQSPDNAQEVEHVKNVMKLYGMSDEFTSKTISHFQQKLGKGLQYEVADVFSEKDQRRYLSPINQKYYDWNAARIDALELKEAGESLDSDDAIELHKLKQYQDDAQRRSKDSSERAQVVMVGKYELWLAANTEASYCEQFLQAWKIKDAYMDELMDSDADVKNWSAYKVEDELTDDSDELVDRAQDSEEEPKLHNEKDVKDADSGLKADDAQQTLPSTPSERMSLALPPKGVTLEGNNSQSILYVPKGSSLVGELITIHGAGRVASQARVVESEAVTSPTMSRKLRGNLGDLLGRNRSLEARGSEFYLSSKALHSGEAVPRTHYNTGQWAGRFNPESLPAALKPLAHDFEEMGAKYGVNPVLLAAISWHETGGGTSSAFLNKKNAMGISDAKGVKAQSSHLASIEHMASLLGRHKIYKGKDLRGIASVYAPVGAGNGPRNLNPHWTSCVNNYIKKLSAK